MIYSINDFEDFLSIFHEMSKMTPEDCINKLMYKTYGTFNYYLPGVSESIIKNEIQNNSVTDLLFYGTGNGIWIKNLNINKKITIFSETAELNTFIKYIMPNLEIEDDKEDKKYDLIIVANSNLEILPLIKEKLKPNGRLIFLASEEFIKERSKAEIRFIIKNYFSVKSLYEIGMSFVLAGNYFLYPFINVNRHGTYYLTIIETTALADSNVDFYFNSYSNKYEEDTSKVNEQLIDNKNFKSFCIEYSELGFRWDYEYNLPYKFKKRCEIEKNGGLLLKNLCDKILGGIKFYYESREISSIYNGLKIFDEYGLKGTQIKGESVIKPIKKSSKLRAKIINPFDPLIDFEGSPPKTNDSWKIEQLIIRIDDIIVSRRNPFYVCVADEKLGDKYIANNDLIIIRGKNSEILKNFFESIEFSNQLDAFAMNNSIEESDIGNFYVPTKFLTSQNSYV